MIQKYLVSFCIHAMTLLSLCTIIPAAHAAVDINAAPESSLQTIKGIGPTRAKLIITERDKNGPYRDAEDLAERIKGLNQKSVARLQAQGLDFGVSDVQPALRQDNAKTSTKSNRPS